MKKQQNLTTHRLLLRALQPDDRDFASTLLSDEKVRLYLGGIVPPHSQEHALASLFSLEADTMVWLAVKQATHERLGLVYLSKHSEEKYFELSYQFAVTAWSKGYATEACKAVVDFALHNLKLERIVAETQAKNLASCRLLERLNMQELRRLQRFNAEQIVFITQ